MHSRHQIYILISRQENQNFTSIYHNPTFTGLGTNVLSIILNSSNWNPSKPYFSKDTIYVEIGLTFIKKWKTSFASMGILCKHTWNLWNLFWMIDLAPPKLKPQIKKKKIISPSLFIAFLVAILEVTSTKPSCYFF